MVTTASAISTPYQTPLIGARGHRLISFKYLPDNMAAPVAALNASARYQARISTASKNAWHQRGA